MKVKKLLAIALSLCMLYGEASYGVPFIKQSITAQAANIEGDYYYFDEALGVLTLSGTVESYLPYSMKGNVRTIIAASGTILPEDCSSLFAGYYNCTSIDLHNADTSNVTNMQKMFHRCSKLKTLDVSSFDTSNVTNMQEMFLGCSDLETLDLSGFDTSNVTNMHGMFGGCNKLKELDVSSFDTGNVTNLQMMFSACANLKELDLSGFDTSNVTNMHGMFQGCCVLTSLDLSNFDTRNVKDMGYMFIDCNNITTLDLSSFDTSKVTDMEYMFSGCKKLESLDLSNFNTSNVTNMRRMFENCSALTKLDISTFDTSNVTDMNSMFYYCSGLQSLDLRSFDTSKVTVMSAMFYNCSGLQSLDLKSFDTSKVTMMNGMFGNCSGLKSLDLKSFDTSKVTWMDCMFENCEKLKTLYLGDNFKRITEAYRLPNVKGWVNVKAPSTIISKDGAYAVFENNGKNTYILYGSDKTFPTNIKCNYSEKYHQLQFTWDKVEGAECYSIAVYMSGKWKIQSSNITTNSCVSPKNLTPGHTYKVAIAAKIDGEWDTANAIKHAVAVTIRYDSEDEVFVISDEWIDDSGSINGNNPEISQNDLDKLKSFNVRAKQTAVYSGNDIDKSSIRMKNELIAVRTRKKDVTDAVFSLTPSRNSDFAFTITGTNETMPEGEYTTDDFNSTVKIFYKEGTFKKEEKQVTPAEINPNDDGTEITYVFALEEGIEYSIYVNNPTNNHVGTYEIHVSEDNWVYAPNGGIFEYKKDIYPSTEKDTLTYISDPVFYELLRSYEISKFTEKYVQEQTSNDRKYFMDLDDYGNADFSNPYYIKCNDNLYHLFNNYVNLQKNEAAKFTDVLKPSIGDIVTVVGIGLSVATFEGVASLAGIILSDIGLADSVFSRYLNYESKTDSEELLNAVYKGKYNIVLVEKTINSYAYNDNPFDDSVSINMANAWDDSRYINKYYENNRYSEYNLFKLYKATFDGTEWEVSD